uniref:superoxide dismutase n=2 Tax=Timema TaxID=61471 RepID=A0A7R9IQK2_9NEOP|nr:unnamed protein product [Timema tahoe]
MKLRVALLAVLSGLGSASPLPRVDDVNPNNEVERILNIRNVPEVPGYSSNLYEVYMEPYGFLSDNAISKKTCRQRRASIHCCFCFFFILTSSQHPEGWFDVISLHPELGMHSSLRLAWRPLTATVQLVAAGGDVDEGAGISGEIIFTQPHPPVGPVIVRGNLTGLSPGQHGMVVHVLGHMREGCDSTGPHYNPYGFRHGAPGEPQRHVGDIGNIRAGPDGAASVDLLDPIISLAGPHSIMGRSLVVHADVDDYGRGGNDESLISGNSGAAVACGVIGYS